MGLYFLPNSWTPVGCTNIFSYSYFRRKVLPFFSFHRADKAVHLQMWPPGLYCHSGNVNFPSFSELHRPAATCLLSGTFSCLFLPIPCSSIQLIVCVHVLIPSGSRLLVYTLPPHLHPKHVFLGTVHSDSVSLELKQKMWSIESGFFCPYLTRKPRSSE